MEAGDTLVAPDPRRGTSRREQDRRKAELIGDWAKLVPPDVFALGEADLELGHREATELLAARGIATVVSNVRREGAPEPTRFAVREIRGWRFLVVNLFGKRAAKVTTAQSLKVEDPMTALDAAIRDAGEFDVALVCLHGMDKEVTRRIAERSDFLKVLIDTDHTIEFRPTSVTTSTAIMRPPDRGTELLVLDLFLKKGAPKLYLGSRFEDAVRRGKPLEEEADAARDNHIVRFKEHLLDSRYPEDPAVKELIAEYNEWVKAYAATIAPTAGGVPYRGAEACGACHKEQLANWRTSYHAMAWETLVKDPEGGSGDPECVSCHVSGFMRPGGPARFEDIGPFKGVQCESCHQPVADHPGGKKKFAKITEALCRECHSETRDPRFDFKTYMPYATCMKPHPESRVPR